MRQRWSETIKGLVLPWLYKSFHPGKRVFECPICGYRGPFKDKRHSRYPGQVREDAKCVRCGAVERHRLQYLVINEVLSDWNASQKKLLHIAPEFCLQPRLSSLFGVYHTADLFRKDVDFKEDIQKMSFAGGSYDCVFVSRVLTNIPDYEAAIREIRRVLKPGGLAIISEAYLHEKTVEFARKNGERSREMGMDALELYGRYFARVERFLSDRYDPKYQLLDRIQLGGRPSDNFPEALRVSGVGCKELVVICRV